MNTRTRVLACATALAATMTVAPGTAEAAHRETPAPGHHAGGFAPVTTLDFDALRIASPAAGQSAVAGIRRADATSEGPLVVATATGRSWTTTTLDATAKDVRIAASDGRTFVMGVGEKPSLWQHDGQRWTSLPLPTTVETMRSMALTSAHGTPVVIGTPTQGAVPAGRTASQSLVVTRYLEGTWQGKATPFEGTNPAPGGVAVPYLALAVQGHVLATTRQVSGYPQVQDLSTSPATPLLGFWLRYRTVLDTPGGFTAQGPTEIVGWGSRQASDSSGGRTETGLCLRSSGTDCPAPVWAVSAATQLEDGRTVLGGRDTAATTDRDGTVRQRVPGGFAYAAPGTTPTPVAGDPGETTLSIAAEPTGTTVWALTRTGDLRQVQKATLPTVGTRR
ncbi:hypothetical protein [Arsenicicoccus dermatophilus]|uniref:hypothetical protein n=1 Tax=Arsenicicoccus dermatophilus TaxID=1076331 RepID=UPI001F4CA674|nr:hypothetical protein [Arsenicicoccus dermatophilus]MCH8612059.1 hypothetical protein [Arsenicicoccus dermatophilus]